MKKLTIVILAILVTLFVYVSWDKTPSADLISQKLVSWQREALTFDYNGYVLSYHDTKNGKEAVVVLLHGYPTSSYDWHLVWNELAENNRLIALDSLGYGLSDKPGGISYSISQQTDIQEALLKKLGIRKVQLLAHDYGDNIAQEMLARYKEQGAEYPVEIDSAVLLNGGLFPETHQATTIQTLLKSPFGGIVSSVASFSLFKKSFAPVFGPETQPSDQDLVDHWYLICQQSGHKINHRLVHAIDERKKQRARWVGALQSTDVPLLLINGLMDPVSGKETVQRYMELVPDPDVKKLETIGHYPHLESPKLVVDHFSSFVKKID